MSASNSLFASGLMIVLCAHEPVGRCSSILGPSTASASRARTIESTRVAQLVEPDLVEVDGASQEGVEIVDQLHRTISIAGTYWLPGPLGARS